VKLQDPLRETNVTPDAYSFNHTKNPDQLSDQKLSKVSEKGESQNSGTMNSDDDDSEDYNLDGNNEDDEIKHLPRWRQTTLGILDSWGVSIFMTVITIYALFFDDIRVLFLPVSLDDFFFTITSICLTLFLIEIIFASIAKPGYFLSFFFWLDVISTVSLIFDIGWIMDLILNGTNEILSIAKTSRAGRVTRVIRVIRLIRLIRIVKLYKQAKVAE